MTDEATGEAADESADEPTIARQVLEYLAENLVDDGESIEIDESGSGDRVDLRLSVAKDDMGRVIGRRGRVAQAIRTVVRAAGSREGIEASVDIVD